MGWSDTEAMNTPIPHILLALDGKIDFVRKTTPGAEADAPAEPPPPDEVANKLRKGMAFFQGKG